MSSVIDCSMNEYPIRVEKQASPPDKLYVEGRLPDEKKPTVAIIGARFCSAYGRYVARIYGQTMGLSGIQVITQMSLGVGGIAAKAALDAEGEVFAVMGCGTDVCYPPEHMELYSRIKENGGIISQFPDGVFPKPAQFETRNSLLVALSDAVIFVEARRKSGTIWIADIAVKMGKPIFALPGRVTDRLSDGTNELLKKGIAGLAFDPDQVAKEIIATKEAAA